MIKIFAGNSNVPLALEICEHLSVGLGKAKVNAFSDGEVQVEIGENVRGRDVFVVQSTCAPTNNHLMEMLVMVDALKRASAARINAVVPYFGYARQDRKVAPRAPITAKLVADLISVAGVDRLLTVDLHAGQIQGFFDIPVDHLYAAPVILEEIRRKNLEDLLIVSPDAGGTERARAFAKRLNAGLAIIDKRRPRPNVAKVMNIIGEVSGRTCLIMDDMVDTANTLCEAAKALKEKGAERVLAYCTHGVLSGPAIGRIENSAIDELVITDTIPLSEAARNCKRIRQLSIAELMAETLRRINADESVSSLFVD